MDDFYNSPIKINQLPQTGKIILNETDENFVDIYAYSNGDIKVDMQYAKCKIPSATKIAYVRETVAKKIVGGEKIIARRIYF